MAASPLSRLARALSPFGGRRVPADVRAALALDPGERLLSHARTPEGEYVVATTIALHLPNGDRPKGDRPKGDRPKGDRPKEDTPEEDTPEWNRLPWNLVDRAAWDEEGVIVTMTNGDVHRVALPEPGLLPETIRERVMSSIVASRHVRLDTCGGVRLVARRVPGTDEPRWELIFDPGLDANDPGLRALAEQALEGVRRNLGV